MRGEGVAHLVTEADIVEGLRTLGLGRSSALIVHSSLSSFGHVEGGGAAVCRALLDTCGTVLMPAFTWSRTALLPPPGLERPLNASKPSSSWGEFESSLAQAVPYSPTVPVDRAIGIIPETLRLLFPRERSLHPLLSFIASGLHARKLVTAQRLDHFLGPVEALAALRGYVLLLGVGHERNTAIHLAEQQLGRVRFYRYAKAAPGVWMELPNVAGCSEGFGKIETRLDAYTREVRVGECHARLVPLDAVLTVARSMIEQDPAALLCEDECDRCWASREQWELIS